MENGRGGDLGEWENSWLAGRSTHKCMGGQTDRRIKEWSGEWKDGLVGGQMGEVEEQIR